MQYRTYVRICKRVFIPSHLPGARRRPRPRLRRLIVFVVRLRILSFLVSPSMYFLLGVSAGHQGGVGATVGGCPHDTTRSVVRTPCQGQRERSSMASGTPTGDTGEARRETTIASLILRGMHMS